MRRTWWMLVLMMLVAVPAAAQDPNDPDEEGCKDSKLLTRLPGCQLYECSSKEFDEVEVVTGAVNPDEGTALRKALEGAIEFLHYVCPAKYSHLQMVRNFESALKKAGFAIVVSGKAEEDNERVITARKGPQWLQLEFEWFNEYPTYKHTAVTLTEMEQVVEADASALGEALDATGSVAVYGINFDTGKATLQAGSEQVLGEVAKLLKARPELTLEVQGHTDNVGQKGANMALSEQRAKAVVAWLTSQGVDGSRLVAKGYGDSAPVADNTSEEGRAKNRRVELKKLGAK